jgi:hypothetical protein
MLTKWLVFVKECGRLDWFIFFFLFSWHDFRWLVVIYLRFLLFHSLKIYATHFSGGNSNSSDFSVLRLL